MIRITVIRQPTPLVEDQYEFAFFEGQMALVLDIHTHKTRPSIRHKFRVEAEYNRLRTRSDAEHTEAERNVPQDVKNEAREQFVSRVRVRDWSVLRADA